MKDRPFINFRKVYENVYLRDDKKKTRYKEDSIFILNKKIRDKHVDLMRDMYKTFQKNFYNSMVEFFYLLSQISIDGMRRDPFKRAGQYYSIIYSHYMNRIIGINAKIIFSGFGGGLARKIMLFVKRQYPDLIYDEDFMENKDKYKYPYKYMDFMCVLAVIEVDEMFDLLEYGEDKKMTRYEFYDYLINYVGCYNKKYGKAAEDCDAGESPRPYIWTDDIKNTYSSTSSIPPHIRDIEKINDKEQLKYEE